MDRKIVGALLLISASCGCRACDCSCDYLPPVLDGPYSSQGMRSGSATASYNRNIEVVEPLADETVIPLQMPE